MQQLVYEPKWKKALSHQDREKIEEAFKSINFTENNREEVSFSVLWHAINHRDDLLVTAFIHNVSNREIEFAQTLVNFGELAKERFTIPISIKPKTSMPWTFIFPTYVKGESFESDLEKSFLLIDE
ncbi:SLAP domain-containing protein [Alkalibacillus silvisoli]|uniref:SLAP domain-containing protein n=1 Tax=Alkalibacillus silvisoli TaxID=392823 RepID=A0ABN0ZVS0_9BACI